MVSSRITRIVGEVLAAEGDVASATRLDVEVAGAAAEASTEEARVSRLSGEVLAPEVDTAGTTRLDVEVAGAFSEANAESVRVTRFVGEVLAGPDLEAAATRLDVEVAGAATEANGETLLVSRIVGEILARQGSAGPVIPQPLNPNASIFLHNWVQSGNLRSAYRTDVRTDPVTGQESRRGLRIKPDRSMGLQWMTQDLDKINLLEITLRSITDQIFQVPLYPDQRELSQAHLSTDTILVLDTTLRRFFVGARIVIVVLDACNQLVSFSFHEILTKTNGSLTLNAALGVDIPAGALVFPVIDCEVVLEPSVKFETSQTPILVMEVKEVVGASTLPPLKSDNPTGFPVLGDRPVFDLEPDWAQPVVRGRLRQGKVTKQGRSSITYKGGERSVVTHSFVTSGNREDQWRAIEFFDTRRGRLRSFMMTDQDQSMSVSEIDASGNFVSISAVGDFADFNQEWDWVGIKMLDGTEYVREVVTVQEVLTVFRLTVDPPLPTNLDISQVARVARARTTRFASEELQETWTHTGIVSLKIDTVEAYREENISID